MEGDLGGTSQLNEFAGTHNVDRAFRRKDSKNDSITSQVKGIQYVILHDLVFAFAVDEVSPARPNDDEDWNRQCRTYVLNHAVAGRDPTLAKGAAQFNAGGSALLRGDC